MDSIEYVHELKEQPWRRRVIRFYNSAIHIIEISELMESAVKRFLDKGFSIE